MKNVDQAVRGESSCLQFNGLGLWVPYCLLESIHDEKVASIGPQRLTNLTGFKINLPSQKGHQLELQTTKFRYGAMWKITKHLEKQEVLLKRRKKRKYICRTIFTLTNRVEDDGTQWFFCMKLDFSTLSSDVSWRSMRCNIASILKQKEFHSNEEMLCSDGVSLFLHQCQKILPALFCWFWAEIRLFSQQKQTVNFKSPKKTYNHVASAVPRRITAVSAEIPAILEKQRRIAKKILPQRI